MRIKRSYNNEIKKEKSLARKIKVMQRKSRQLLLQSETKQNDESSQNSISDLAWTFCMLFINGAPLTYSPEYK